MTFKDKYTNEKDKEKESEKNKTPLPNEFYALIEALEALANSINRSRL